MDLGVYAHPWNVSPTELGRLQELRVNNVAMAVSYHAGRWTTPSTDGLVRSLEDGVVHFQPSEDYGRLQPLPSQLVRPDRSPLREFLAGCGAAGIEGHAWTVLFHNSRLGRANPDLCITNALGDAYTWALCPSQPNVQRYGLALLRDIGMHEGLAAIEIEAAGFFGYRHSSHHDKGSFVVDQYFDFLLSYCFCEACVRDLDEAGMDGARARDRVGQLLRRALVEGDAMQPSCFTHLNPTEDIPPDILAGLQQRRTQSVVAFLHKVREVVPGDVRITSHLVPDPMFTGSQLGMEPGVARSNLDGVLLTHYGQNAKAIGQQWAGWRFPGEGEDNVDCTVCVWPKAPQFVLEEDLVDVRKLADAHGLGGIRIYHAGLLPSRTLERACAALA